MRSLVTLGTTSDSCGTLLTRVILRKLPTESKTRMARDHYDTEWIIDDLITIILKEIWIFEPGQQSGRRTNPVSTASSFYMSANHGAATKFHVVFRNSHSVIVIRNITPASAMPLPLQVNQLRRCHHLQQSLLPQLQVKQFLLLVLHRYNILLIFR